MALDAHRLEADLTYRALAARIGLTVSKTHGLLNRPAIIANDRTAYKVRRYLASLRRGRRRGSRASSMREAVSA